MKGSYQTQPQKLRINRLLTLKIREKEIKVILDVTCYKKILYYIYTQNIKIFLLGINFLNVIMVLGCPRVEVEISLSLFVIIMN